MKVMRIKNLFILAIIAIFTYGCSATRNESRVISVTIPPLKGIVSQIVGEGYEIVVILPQGTAPETYSPTISQLSDISSSEYVFAIGTLNFEQTIINSLSQSPDCKVFTTSNDIELLSGCCSHSHKEGGHSHAHSHSIDPHVWMSHDGLWKIVDNITNVLTANNPDSTTYLANAERIKERIVAQKAKADSLLDNAPKSFLIYHPALGYFAAEQGLEQIALENEGKNPTPKSLASTIDRVNSEGLNIMLYQQEYPRSIVKPIAEILGVNLFDINPLSDDAISELDKVINILSMQNEKE